MKSGNKWRKKTKTNQMQICLIAQYKTQPGVIRGRVVVVCLGAFSHVVAHVVHCIIFQLVRFVLTSYFHSSPSATAQVM